MKLAKENVLDYECSCFCLSWLLLPEIDVEAISRPWCAMVNIARSHEERLKLEAVSPDIHKQAVRWHDPPHVMRARMTAAHLIGSYFFDGPLNAASYAEMLQVWLIPQLGNRGLMEDVFMQCNGAPVHSPLLRATFSMNIRATGLAMVHKHIPCHYPGHHIILILPYWITLCWALLRGKWVCTAIATVMHCAELWNRCSPPLCHKCLGTSQRTLGYTMSLTTWYVKYWYNYFSTTMYFRQTCCFLPWNILKSLLLAYANLDTNPLNTLNV
jgi:hypothetical protein